MMNKIVDLNVFEKKKYIKLNHAHKNNFNYHFYL